MHPSSVPQKQCKNKEKCIHREAVDGWLPAIEQYFAPYKVKEWSGLRNVCRECRKRQENVYYENNREKFAEYGRRLRKEKPDLVRKRKRIYYEANRDQIREHQKQYLKDHPGIYDEANRRWKENNPDRVRENHRRWWKENCESLSQKRSEYYLEHRDEIITKAAIYHQAHRQKTSQDGLRWRKAHKEELQQYYRNYAKTHPEVVRASSENRRARKRKAIGTHTAKDIRLQVKMQTDQHGKLHCWWCGKIIDSKKYHVDHRIPLAKGGSNAPENLVISCPPCNQSKNAKLPQDFNGRLL